MSLNTQLSDHEENTANTNKQLEEVQKKLEAKTKELLESTKKNNMLAVAKTPGEFEEVVSKD